MAGVFISHGEELIHKLSRLPATAVIDMQNECLELALSTVAEIAFGVKLSEWHDERAVKEFARAFDLIQFCTEKRWYMPWYGFNRCVGVTFGLGKWIEQIPALRKNFLLSGFVLEHRIAKAVRVLNSYVT